MIKIKKLNELYLKLETDDTLLIKRIYSKFSLYSNNYKYEPSYIYGMWDGMIHFLNLKDKTFPIGLLYELIDFLNKDTSIEYSIDRDLIPKDFNELLAIYENTFIPLLSIKAHYYQIDIFKKAILKNKGFILSPTASGKSFLMYLIVCFYIKNLDNSNKNILISVNSTNLVRQLHNDFISYDNVKCIENDCFEFNDGNKKYTDKRITIATWQMIVLQSKEWFEQFDVYLMDEAHQASTASSTKIMLMMPHVKFKYGFTGTLDGTKTHELQCKSWFGNIIRGKKTHELIEEKYVSDFEINFLILKYNEEECRKVKNLSYVNEIDYIINHKKRNSLIVDLALNQSNNTLVLFHFIDKHGMFLYKEALQKAEQNNKNVKMIIGKIDVDERENIRQLMEKNNNIVLFATFDTLSVGVNITNLHYLIFAHPYKGRIRNLQSIGRSLRKNDNKKCAILYDVCDDFTIDNKHNIVYKHFKDRCDIYKQERFKFSFEIKKMYD